MGDRLPTVAQRLHLSRRADSRDTALPAHLWADYDEAEKFCRMSILWRNYRRKYPAAGDTYLTRSDMQSLKDGGSATH